MAERIPRRLWTAVEVLDPPATARVLEVGCGVGVAAGLVCRRLTTGHLTGLDRSGTAIERAERRLATYLEDGRADLQHRDLSTFHGDGRPYDLVFAVNVNVFWTGPATAEVERLTDLLAADGTVRLFYELPGRTEGHPAETMVSSALERGGLTADVTRPPGMLCITGRPSATGRASAAASVTPGERASPRDPAVRGSGSAP